MEENNLYATEETCIKLNTLDTIIDTNYFDERKPLKTQSSMICTTEEKSNVF